MNVNLRRFEIELFELSICIAVKNTITWLWSCQHAYKPRKLLWCMVRSWPWSQLPELNGKSAGGNVLIIAILLSIPDLNLGLQINETAPQCWLTLQLTLFDLSKLRSAFLQRKNGWIARHFWFMSYILIMMWRRNTWRCFVSTYDLSASKLELKRSCFLRAQFKKKSIK